jgi:hypothetical protein
MVLQRAPAQAKLWGWATPGAQIQATLDGTTPVAATADAQGQWSLKLAAQDAQAGRSITIAGAGATVTLGSVAFGDVFVCAGQSHMTFSVNQDLNGSATIAESGNYSGIRMLTIDTDAETTPLADAKRVKYKGNSTWLVSAPESFGSSTFSYPSAICYYYAREIYSHFNAKVPIGIISASVGGSAIEFWMSDDSRADGLVKTGTCGGSKAKLAAGCGMPSPAADASATTGPETATPSDSQSLETGVAVAPRGWTPGCFYNGMIHPLGQMSLRGMLWDQGEANQGDNCLAYGCKLAALAHDWRTNLFQQPSVLFTFDQLRADDFAAGMGVPSYPKAIPHSTFSTRVDLQTCYPDHTSEGHAVRKLEVGRRLAMAARVAEYAETATPLSFGPSIVGVGVEVYSATASAAAAAGGAAAAAVAAAPQLLNVSIMVEHAMGLHFSDAPECPGCCDGKAGPLIQGNPAHGDAFTVGFVDGTSAVVCKDTTVSEACTGGVQIVDGTSPGSKTIRLVMVATAFTQLLQAAPAVKFVQYGGSGPWLSSSTSSPGPASASVLAPVPVPVPAPAPPPCSSQTFSGHTCAFKMTNLTSPSITTADECVAACCAATKFVCNYAGWESSQKACIAGDEHNQGGNNCPRNSAWDTFLVNWAPVPVPPSPAPVKCVYPHQFRFGIEACALYNGQGGYDSHAGVAMAAQLYQTGATHA